MLVPVIGRKERGTSAVATAFVVRDDAGREFDIHVLTLDGRGSGIPAWNADVTYPPDALAGRGVIADTLVRCLSALVGYTAKPSLLQLLAYVGYLVGIGAAAWYRSRPAPVPATAPANAVRAACTGNSRLHQYYAPNAPVTPVVRRVA